MGCKKLAIFALKGGTGKTTVTGSLGLALKRLGYKVGFMDQDITGPKLPGFLGMSKPYPHPEVNVATSKMYPIRHDGYEIFSLAFRFDDGAIMWHGGEEQGMKGTGISALVKQMLAHVAFSEDRDFILYDLPPSSSDPALSFFETLKDLWGVILVCQPTKQSVDDIVRSLDLIEQKRIPLLGMVGNMVCTVCPHCGQQFTPFVDGGIDLQAFCASRGVPYLASIPLTPSGVLLAISFRGLAEKVISARPVKLWDRPLASRIQTGIMTGVVKSYLKGKE